MTDDIRKHCEFGGMAGPVAKIKKLPTACLVATKGRLEQIKAMAIDSPVTSLAEARMYGIPVYSRENDADVAFTAIAMAMTYDEVWIAMDSATELFRLPAVIRDVYQQKEGDA